ncbi:MAG: outer membrane protein assembly factor BamD [Myxococcales bacterium]
MRRLLVLSSLLASCSGFSANVAGEVTYLKTAEGNFEAGEKSLKSKDYLDAISYFQYVKNKFPYSHFAPLAELRVADANFDQEKWTEAVDGYKNFIKDHPTHREVDYAGFRIGLSHYKDVPTDFFLVPPSYEKDQQPLLEAQSSIKDFLASYPDSQYTGKAKELLADVRKRLARHELYVAQYYQSHERPRAAAWRYQGLIRDFPDTPFAAEARQQVQRLLAKLGPEARLPSPEAGPSTSDTPPSSH